jgi:Ca2+-binding RTX toxin-like protein
VKAKHANDHFIYNTTTGDLYYDADGKGGKAAIHFATLTDGSRTPPQHLDAGDFLIV